MEEGKHLRLKVLRCKPDLKVPAKEEVILLAAPLFDNGIPPALDAHAKALTRMCDRLGFLSFSSLFCVT